MFPGTTYLLGLQHRCLQTGGVMLGGLPAKPHPCAVRASHGDGGTFPFLFPSQTQAFILCHQAGHLYKSSKHKSKELDTKLCSMHADLAVQTQNFNVILCVFWVSR